MIDFDEPENLLEERCPNCGCDLAFSGSKFPDDETTVSIYECPECQRAFCHEENGCRDEWYYNDELVI